MCFHIYLLKCFVNVCFSMPVHLFPPPKPVHCLLCVLTTFHVFQVGHHRAAHPLPHPRCDGPATHEVGAAPRDPEGAASFCMKV